LAFTLDCRETGASSGIISGFDLLCVVVDKACMSLYRIGGVGVACMVPAHAQG